MGQNLHLDSIWKGFRRGRTSVMERSERSTDAKVACTELSLLPGLFFRYFSAPSALSLERLALNLV